MTAVRDGEEGTTLLELLVALSLLALLSVYAVSAIRYLQNFDRVQTLIEERSAMEAVRTHLRRSIETMRTAFLVSDGSSPKLAFSGEKEAISFVTHADSRLEYGGLYLVRFAVTEDAAGMRDVVTTRRAFRPRIDPAAGGDGLLVLARIESLSFSYFGSPREGVKPEWHADWPEANVLPQAIRVEIGFAPGDRRTFAPFDIPVAVAK